LIGLGERLDGLASGSSTITGPIAKSHLNELLAASPTIRPIH